MSSKDHDLLDKLFDVEKKAEALVADARTESDRRIAAAKERAEADFSAAYEAAVKEANSNKAAAVASTAAEYEKAISAFRGSIESTPVDEASFRASCDSALAGSAPSKK